jgi:hypothetical protein
MTRVGSQRYKKKVCVNPKRYRAYYDIDKRKVFHQKTCDLSCIYIYIYYRTHMQYVSHVAAVRFGKISTANLT